MKSPFAKVIPHETTIHGITLKDDYYWLRDRTNPDVISYLTDENSYTDEILENTKVLQESLYDEMLSHVKEDDTSLPFKLGEYWYYNRQEKGKQYRIYCRKHISLEAEESIILDCNLEAEGREYFALGAITPSLDGKRIAYTQDVSGSELYQLVIKDLQENRSIDSAVIDIYDDIEWANDNDHVYYLGLDEIHRPCKVFRHEIRTEQSNDALLFEDSDDTHWVSIEKTKSRKFIIVASSTKNTSECYLLDCDDNTAPLHLIQARLEKTEYYPDHRGDELFFNTNHQAKSFCIMKCNLAATHLDNWVEVVPHIEAETIDSFELLESHLIVRRRVNGLDVFTSINTKTGESLTISFDEPTYAAWFEFNNIMSTSRLRIGYGSLLTPESIYEYDLSTGDRVLLKQHEVLGGYDPANYTIQRLFAMSHDGVQIPMSIAYKNSTPLDGSAPCYLYAYGSYGSIIPPRFSASKLVLLDHGFVYVFAHIRGGGDMGRHWYDDGKLMKKRNTFLDFIACAENLIANNFTSPERLTIEGGSAGGLLMGAVLTMRPELFQACIADVPFVDVVNTMLDPTIPLTTSEYVEWGDPNELSAFEYIRSYSPYDNLRQTHYPHLLVKGGLNDPRVQYWEPAKFVAKLRSLKIDENLLLLKTEMGAGHGGPSGRYSYLRDIACDFAFLLKAVATNRE